MQAHSEQSWEEIGFWRELCPGLPVTEAELTPGEEPYPIDPAVLQREKDYLKEEGYLHLPSVLPAALAEQLAQVVETVTEATGYPLLALVYDPFWSVLMRLEPLLSAILGEDYRVLPDCWAWRLKATPEDKGWKPHRDRQSGTLNEDGLPNAISLWLPLTDATPQNGCMYVLPATHDKRYGIYGEPGETGALQLQDIRAVPATAGSVLLWSSQLLHWGGRSSHRAQQPRISYAFELQSASLKPQAPFLLDPAKLPGFRMRLALIGRQLLQYQHMHPLSDSLKAWSQRRSAELPQKRSFANVLKKLLKG